MKQSALGRYFALGIAAFAAMVAIHARGVVREVASTNDVSSMGGGIGGDIVYKFAMEDGSIEYAHVFTNTAASATFTIPAGSLIAERPMRILAVGGGGSGGSDCGGGGGAGGFIETNDCVLSVGDYTINVGAGGAKAVYSAQLQGNNGGATTITNATENIELLCALGGGGGGSSGSGAGLDGASGGGGSTGDAAGAGTEGQGYDGGAGSTSSYGGGGGGGAGGKGVDSNANGTTGGNGGPGKTSDITGESVTYACGGGGRGSSTAGMSGDGIWDDGYGEPGNDSRYGQPGKPGTGSGGGGGGAGGNRTSGEGGSGIVVFRYVIPRIADGTDATSGEANGQAFYRFGADGTFTVRDLFVKARVLAVGGGGSGANAGFVPSSLGGAGGGGAGGMIDGTYYFSRGFYSIDIGEGGAAQATDSQPGNDGKSTYIYDANTTAILQAYGGGGGGIANDASYAPGRAGGSGGGGSRYSSTVYAGGAAVSGQGNPGGDGQIATSGAGGGGAGGKGGDAETANQGGAGGVGLASDITGTAIIYAAGGGGGAYSGTGGVGGDKIGGSGASDSTAATAGVENTGSGGGGGSNASHTGGAGGSGIVVIRIEKVRTEPLVMPAALDLGSVVYDGEEKCLYKDYDADFMEVTGTIVATDVGEYEFTVTPKPGVTWANGTTTSITCTWEITAPTLSEDGFSMAGWQYGEVVSVPYVKTTPTIDASLISFEVSPDGEDNWSAWDGDALEVGKYKMRLIISESGNYVIPAGWESLGGGKYVAATTTFSVVENGESLGLPDYLGYHTIFEVTTDPGATLENFPMLVRVSDATMPGVYNNTRSDLSDIRFTMVGDSDTQLPFEIDTWNPDGESFIWVKVPEYKLGTQVVMNWGEIADAGELPALSTDSVWEDYAGVWHFNEDVTAETAATTKAADSTQNHNDAVPTKTVGDLSVMVSQPGPIGNARVNGVYNKSSGLNGNITWFKIENFDNSSYVDSAFTFSGWIKATEFADDITLVSTKESSSATSEGWEVKIPKSSRSKIQVFGDGNVGSDKATVSSGDIKSGFIHVTVVYDGTTASVFAHGDDTGHFTTTGLTIGGVTATTGLAFGCNLVGTSGDTSNRPFWGLFDELRIRKGAVTPAWARAEYAQAAGASTPSALYITTGMTMANHWIKEPSATPQSLVAGDSVTVDPGESEYGTVEWWYESASGDKMEEDVTEFPLGTYDIVFHVAAGSLGSISWTELEKRITITIREMYPQYSLGEAAEVTRLGRVLLANDDENETQPVEGQAYDLSELNVIGDNATYWVHEKNVDVNTFDRLKPATKHTLKCVSPVAEICGATDIWYLDDVRIGNTYSYTAGGQRITSAYENYLPQSRTAKPIFDESSNIGSVDESASMVMRNVENAAIYSPCYTNGIGTIYFDAVNRSVNHNVSDAECFRIVVEVCTNSMFSTDYSANSNGQWRQVELTAIKVVNGVAVSTTKTNELALDIEAGGSRNNFYRVIVDKEVVSTRDPVRFRIRRSGINLEEINVPDGDYMILIDNIEVSPPPSRVDMMPLGNYDSAKGGSQVTGWSGAFEPAFPGITTTDIYGRMDANFYVNYLTNSENGGTNMLQFATMYYRWRYLGQEYDPESGSEWKSVALSTTEDFRTVTPLEVPRRVGDIEFWTVLIQGAPFYIYYDYTGLGLGTPGYTEEISVITNRCNDASVTGKTRGTDWFVRIRDGKSSWEKFGVTIIGVDGGTNTYYATLADEETWRCYFKTPTNETGTIKFRLEGYNRQTDGSRDWNEATTLFAIDGATGGNDDANQQGRLSATYSERANFSDGDWFEFDVDAKTGYLLFQMEDASRSITIVHADYQNFNEWTDAAKTPLFIGSFSEDANKPASGVSNEKLTYAEDFESWNDMSVSYEDYWAERFYSTTKVPTDDNFEDSSTFTTLNGWTAKYARYVNESLYPLDQYALQLRGNGLGAIEYSSGAYTPRGIGDLSFTARIANSIDWDDISYCDLDGMSSLRNYTFVTGVKAITNTTEIPMSSYSVSLVANYRQKKGCYEFRFVHTSNTVDRTRNRCRIELWKWAKNNKSYLLGSGTFTDLATNSGLIKGSDFNKWAKMAISVSNEVAGVRIVGVMNNSVPSDAIYYGGDEYNEPGKTTPCYVIEYLDTGAIGGAAISNGTVGVVSANCPAQFHFPRYYTEPLTFTTTLGSYPDAGSLEGFKAYGGSVDITFPGTSEGPNETLTTPIIDSDTGDYEDFDDWALESTRIMPAKINNHNSLKAVANTQTLGVFLAPSGSTSFGNTPVTNVVVSSFFTNNTTMALRTIDDCSLQIRVIENDNPADVVIDNLRFSQWRGDDWNNVDSDVIPGKPKFDPLSYAYTNFTFTSCWVTNNSVLMSARRTATNGLCSIVSPLMDGWEYSNGEKRGTGLGQISFSFHDAQTNAVVTVQVLTNATNLTQGEIYSEAWTKDSAWINITNFTFETESSGSRSCYLGMRGVHGLMRIVVNDDLVNEVSGSEDEELFGDIYIDSVVVRDEPDLDYGSWWGWNIRTFGDSLDSEGRMLIGDVSETVKGGSETATGLSLAINNSITQNVDESDYDTCKRHLPFVQSPTFNANIVGGVTFKARHYAYTESEDPDYEELNSRPAFVTLYGSFTGEENGTWIWLKDFEISTDYFTNITYTTSSSETYKAFRFVVRGVDGIDGEEDYNNDPASGRERWDKIKPPVRIILDEVAVTEAIRPRVGFRFVGAFRSDMNGTEPVPGVPCETEQPICKEAWGVQCEIYKAQLPDMIDLDSDTNPPEVILHWYVGENNWGFDNWKTNKSARSVMLYRAEPESSFVFRSTYQRSENGQQSIVPEVNTPSTVVQYMLEVRYNQFNDMGESVPATNFLMSSEWATPEWYRPLDYNTSKGNGSAFSAYTIIDTVAPHWAWINEVNVFGGLGTDGYSNVDKDCQFVEVAAPADADLTGWYLQFVANQGTEVITNKAAIFGVSGLSGTKTSNKAYGMTFRVVGSPASQESSGGKLKYSDGSLDGVWTFDGRTTVYARGEISPFYPIAVQLVRPRGILESEIVAVGTNYYAQWTTEYAQQYYPENTVTLLNDMMDGANFIYIGSDDNLTNDIITNSLSVVTNVGGSYACWTNDTYTCWTNGVARTPGRLNAGQVIEGTPPRPGGTSRIIFSSVVGKHIKQMDPDTNEWTTNDVAIYVQRNTSTNLAYFVDNWHKLLDVDWTAAESNATGKAVAQQSITNEWFASVGTNFDCNITVTASAAAQDDVLELIGDDTRYSEAILDWLAAGMNIYGTKWPASADGKLHLAEFHTLNDADAKLGDLSLAQMYWLDIPPTVSNMWLKGGLWKFELVHTNNYPYADEELDNYRMGIQMIITNANGASSYTVNGKRGWSPYVLRGVEPGLTSWAYAGTNSLDTAGISGRPLKTWQSATLNISGKMLTEKTSAEPDKYWLTLMKFVFNEDSFDANHKSEVDVLDVNSEYSPAYWEFQTLNGDFVDGDDDEESVLTAPFFRWNLKDDINPLEVMLLAPTNSLY